MMFEREFGKVLSGCELIFFQHYPTKGDSWKKCSIEFLENKLKEEITEFDKALSLKDQYVELLDTVIVSLMLAERLRQRINHENL